MKYIRTKDGKIWSFSNPNNIFLYEGSDKKNGKWLHEIGEVSKEADTIEELCDEFVFVDESGKKDLVDGNYKAKLQECGTSSVVRVLMKQDRPKELYGAIWTDKGLIYVAKMNGKWELELL